ncbi:DUF418 domain-containing protein [Pontibacillus halophilus]|uniref:DUF418 domain-containing protein n=1 Tax=Pontibacillus halophilus TaxID=516704 RepID=UPI0004094DC9|nr:DUF418 domain-containing protein [Pontibacillus halophilus]
MYRNQVVDALRGLSLFGILIANMLIFQYGMFGKDEIHRFNVTTTDRWIREGLTILVESSFMPIFAFLFGYGVVKMTEKLSNQGLRHKRYLSRRFVCLLLLGGLHAYYLWEGDILLTYGMTGFILLFFINRKSKTILIWSVVLLALGGASVYGGEESLSSDGDERIMSEYMTETETVNGGGSYQEIKFHRNNVDPLNLSGGEALVILLLVPLFTLPMFLIGMIAAKRSWFVHIEEHRHRWQRGAILGSIVGISCKSFVIIFPALPIGSTFYLIGGPILSLGYISMFVLVLNRDHLLVRGLSSVGRYSLTNYILQSVVCTTLFYGYGFGWFGKIGVTAGVGISFLLFALQWGGSLLYSQYFRTGPLEWVIRVFTYLKWSGKPTSRNVTEEISHKRHREAL